MLRAFHFFFFFNDTATTEIYTTTDTLSLHDALPISVRRLVPRRPLPRVLAGPQRHRSEEHTSELQSPVVISYAVFCLKKKKIVWLLDPRPRMHLITITVSMDVDS